MRQSIRIGRVGGIEIGLHWSVPVGGARRVTLWPLGGVCELAVRARSRRVGLLVAAAGPVASLLQSGAAEVAVLVAKSPDRRPPAAVT